MTKKPYPPGIQFKHLLLSISILLSVQGISQAQTLPVGSHVLEDYYRRLQLLGQVDSTISFALRPISAEALGVKDIFDPRQELDGKSRLYEFPKGDGYVQALSPSFILNTNSKYNYGWNDGPMVPTRGGQFMISGGIFAKYKFLSAQFMPEIVQAGNRRYDDMGNMPGYGREWYRYHANRIDAPLYFGKSNYFAATLGQSYLKATFGGVSFGLSSENLYWGPGLRNSLLMSNNAPGFPHLTVHTAKPVSTPIGSFEGQIVGGWLKASGYPHSLTPESQHEELWGLEKMHSGNRYFSGFTASYQPKWLPGLHLGIIRSFVVNTHDMGGKLQDVLPFFSPSVKEVTYLNDDGRERTSNEVRDRYGSVFFRWVMPAAKLEVYGEYGRDVKPENGRDWMVQAGHSRAYVLGFRKLVPLRAVTGDYLLLGGEATELSATNSYFNSDRNLPPWYTHQVVRHGYTHRGQVLGAGIGPGSNLQSVQIGWVRDMKQIGLQFERLAHNEDFFYRYVADVRKGWVDLGWTLYGEWDYEQFLFSARIHRAYAQNYRYAFEGGPSFWTFKPQDEKNLTVRLGVSYRF